MQIVFLFYEGMTALDAIGPLEILSRLPGAVIRTVARKPGPIKTSSGLLLIAESAIREVLQADVLVVPGAKNGTTLRQFPEILSWIRSIHQTTLSTTAVCTGSLILGAAGLLKGLHATTHWAVLDRLEVFGAFPKKERVVEEGKVITAAGVSAGLDMALVLAAKLAGVEVARSLQLTIEYDPKPPFDCGSPDKVDPEFRDALKKRILSSFETL